MAEPPPSHPLLAAVYDLAVGPAERVVLRPLRERALSGLTGDVLDLGAGTGANFPVFAAARQAGVALRVTALEPDPHMLRRARRRAAELDLPVTFADAPAEALPFPAASFDAIAATLVLCTVRDPERALAEAARVLRPGGELRFIEHVRGDGRAAHWQDRVRPVWAACAGGCQLNRDTGAMLRRAFAQVRWTALDAPFPVCLVLVGRAVTAP
jgi:ubiquinone/menaquinone biosynthesis C-methylase UbiE